MTGGGPPGDSASLSGHIRRAAWWASSGLAGTLIGIVIATSSLSTSGSMSACHGSCREGEVELLPQELGTGVWDIQKKIKAALDPNHIMNTGKYLFDQAYRG